MILDQSIRTSSFLLIGALLLAASTATAETIGPPDYQSAALNYLYPVGGQRGTEVWVEFGGDANSMIDPQGVIIDGPPGITVKKIERLDVVDGKPTKVTQRMRVLLAISKDALPGLRMLRAKAGAAGLTNARYFCVGTLPEHLEVERNDSLDKAEIVSLPRVINGRIQKPLDSDCYRFRVVAKEPIVAAIASHSLDCMRPGRVAERGFVDTTLEILDANGIVLHQADDTIGLDPVIHFVPDEDAWLVARVTHSAYVGYPEAVYRLTIGNVPYVTSAFPAGGKVGTEQKVEFFGLNLPGRHFQSVRVTDENAFPFQFLNCQLPNFDLLPLRFVRGKEPCRIEREPNNSQPTATPLNVAETADGRFDKDGDVDWYRIPAEKGDRLSIEILAQRMIRSPVDTQLAVFDKDGEQVAFNDDGPQLSGEFHHDFETFDSAANFQAKYSGDYFVRVSEASGAFGHRAVYRLTARKPTPDFRLFQWPDAVSIWGPGSTAAIGVDIEELGAFKSRIELSVEGLPKGWTSTTGLSPLIRSSGATRAGVTMGKAIVTVTAPNDVAVGTVLPFRVVGEAVVDGQKIKRVARPTTVYFRSNPMIVRASPVSRLIVTAPTPPYLTTSATELKGTPGETIKIPLRLEHTDANSEYDTTVHVIKAAVAERLGRVSLGPPIKVASSQNIQHVEYTIPKSQKPGTYTIAVARSWTSYLLGSAPGPCTSIIRLKVEAAVASNRSTVN